MQPHQERVVNEQVELQDKLTKLTAFIETSKIYADLPQPERDSLFRQAIHMREYNGVLLERIARF